MGDSNWGDLEETAEHFGRANLAPEVLPLGVRIMVIWELNTNMTPFYHHWLMKLENLVYDYIYIYDFFSSFTISSHYNPYKSFAGQILFPFYL